MADLVAIVTGGLLTGASPGFIPGAPVLTGAVAGDTEVVLTFTADDAADVIYARYRRVAAGQEWSAESETFKRTGSGTITITGLTNSWLYEFTGYAKDDDSVLSVWAGPRMAIPTDSKSILEQAAEAVVAVINAASLVDSGSDAITAVKTIPPAFRTVATAQIIVYPAMAPSEAAGNAITLARPVVHIWVCERGTTAAQYTGIMLVVEQVRNLFVGLRLGGMSHLYCILGTHDGPSESLLDGSGRWVDDLVLTFELTS